MAAAPLAEQEAHPEAAYTWNVAYSPDGTLVTFGPNVVEVATGKVMAQGLLENHFWSPDSRYVLSYSPRSPFQPWGKVALLDVTTGDTTDLGTGIALGWDKDDQALFVRWPLAKDIPGPGKGCP